MCLFSVTGSTFLFKNGFIQGRGRGVDKQKTPKPKKPQNLKPKTKQKNVFILNLTNSA